jgi:hypothetical protein
MRSPVLLCDSCAEALPKGGAADTGYCAHLGRNGLAHVEPQGRA